MIVEMFDIKRKRYFQNIPFVFGKRLYKKEKSDIVKTICSNNGMHLYDDCVNTLNFIMDNASSLNRVQRELRKLKSTVGMIICACFELFSSGSSNEKLQSLFCQFGEFCTDDQISEAFSFTNSISTCKMSKIEIKKVAGWIKASMSYFLPKLVVFAMF